MRPDPLPAATTPLMAKIPAGTSQNPAGAATRWSTMSRERTGAGLLAAWEPAGPRRPSVPGSRLVPPGWRQTRRNSYPAPAIAKGYRAPQRCRTRVIEGPEASLSPNPVRWGGVPPTRRFDAGGQGVTRGPQQLPEAADEARARRPGRRGQRSRRRSSRTSGAGVDPHLLFHARPSLREGPGWIALRADGQRRTSGRPAPH